MLTLGWERREFWIKQERNEDVGGWVKQGNKRMLTRENEREVKDDAGVWIKHERRSLVH